MIEKKYPIEFALVSRNYSDENTEVETVSVRETRAFYIVQKNGFEQKYKKLTDFCVQGRVSEQPWGVEKNHRPTSYLYLLTSPIVQKIRKKHNRQNFVKKVSNEIRVLLQNENDPRIDEIAKILGIELD